MLLLTFSLYHKCLCRPVTICATLVVPNFLSILTPVTLKIGPNPRQLLRPCQVHPRCKFGDCRSVACRDNADISTFYDALKPSKVGQGDLVFGLRRLITSMSLCARFQLPVHSSYDLRHHLMSQTYTQAVLVQVICIAQLAMLSYT